MAGSSKPSRGACARPVSRPCSATSPKQAASLLEGKAVKLTGCISKTTGKTFDCKAKLKKDGTIEPMFDSKPKGKYNKARR